VGTTMMYYPFVHPPRPVLWQALLYWDNLTSISPVDGYQYQFGSELTGLQDLGLYRPTHADDLPPAALAYLVSDLRRVVEELPGEDLVPVPGPLNANNRVYTGASCRSPSRTTSSKSGRSLRRSGACTAYRRYSCRAS
jgi:hypothetical protein